MPMLFVYMIPVYIQAMSAMSLSSLLRRSAKITVPSKNECSLRNLLANFHWFVNDILKVALASVDVGSTQFLSSFRQFRNRRQIEV